MSKPSTTQHSPTPLLSVDGIECRHDSSAVVDQVSFEISAGMSACLLGPSGCGKTTLLRAIAGLEPVFNGSIAINGTIASSRDFIMDPEQRDIGLVFQDHALFPHLSVFDNVAFGLRKLNKKEKAVRVAECLALVGLEHVAERFPHQLSGGQQQRIALARTLAPRPKLILLDEPFSSLDTHLRRSLARELKELLKSQGIASLLVTHDQQEAFAMADHIGVMHQGQLLQWDTPYNLYHEPADAQIAAFIGEGKFIAGRVKHAQQVSTILGDFSIAHQSHCPQTFTPDSSVLVLMRPDDIKPNPQSGLRGRVIHKIFKGAIIEYELELSNKEHLTALFPSHYDYELAQDVGFDLDVQHLIVYQDHISV